MSNFDWQKHLNFGFSNDAGSQFLVGKLDEVANLGCCAHGGGNQR